MRNTKKIQSQRFTSVDLKKAVAVIKCFICNQMFYSQLTFDQHMKQHSSKLSKNIPQEIQRKTMQSFRVKKNTIPTIGSNSNNVNRKLLNQTATNLRTKQSQKIIDKTEDQEIRENKKQIQQTQQALRQSILLIEKIQALTHQDSKQDSPQKLQQKTANNNSKEILKQISQQQLIKIYLQNNKLTLKQIQSTVFINQYLKSYQDQLNYLNQMYLSIQGSGVDNKKIQTMRNSILKTIQEFIKQNVIYQIQKQQQNSIYLTNTNKQNKSKQLNQDDMEIIDNNELAYCNQCYLGIQFDQQCYSQKQNKKDNNNNNNKEIQTKIKYHVDCWQQRYDKK